MTPKKRKTRRKRPSNELRLELRRQRKIFGAPLEYRKLLTMVEDVINRVATTEEIPRLYVDGKIVYRFGAGQFDLGIKGQRQFMLLFRLEDDGGICFLMTLIRKGKYLPNLVRHPEDIDELDLFNRLVRELCADKNFRVASEVAEF